MSPSSIPTLASNITLPAAPGTAPSNTVSWQSVFFGLAPLALNAMTQRSLLDVSFPTNSLLFAMRSSPFICIADLIDIVVAVLVYLSGTSNRRNGLEDGPVIRNVDMGLSHVEGGMEEDTRRSVAQNHPWVFLVLFVGTATQAVKIWGFEGLVWTKLWAAAYLLPYLAIALLDLFVPSNRRQEILQSPHYYGQSPLRKLRLTVLIIALVIHFFTFFWTVYQIWHVDILILREPDVALSAILVRLPILMGISIGALLVFSPVWMLLLFPTWAAFRIDAILTDLNRDESTPPQSFKQRLVSILHVCLLRMAWVLMLAIVFVGFCVSISVAIDFRMHVADIIVQGLGLIILCGVPILALFQFLFSGKFARSGVLTIISIRNPDPKTHGSLIAFALMNFLIPLLYYSIRYDPEGTVKPAWTEKLG